MKRQNHRDGLDRSIKRKPELFMTDNTVASSAVRTSAIESSVHRTLMRVCHSNLLLQQQIPLTNYRYMGATTTFNNPVHPHRIVQSTLSESSQAEILAEQVEPSNVLIHHEYETIRDTCLPTFIFRNNGVVRDTVLNQSDSTQRCHADNELLRVAILHQQENDQIRAATLSTISPILSGMANGNSSNCNQIHQLHERDTLVGHPTAQYRYRLPTINTRWSLINPNPSPEELLTIHQQIRGSMFHNQLTSIPYPTLSTSAGGVMMPSPQIAPINYFGNERVTTNILSHGVQSITMNQSLLNRTDDRNLTTHFTTTTIPVGAVPQQPQQSSITARLVLPSCVAQPIDVYKISAHQCLLREQMEYFAAAESDVQIHVRGRNKAITIGQVGIRCKHCAHVPISKRQKGSTYFPSNKLGIYQAAQNMSTTHIQCGLCTFTPDRIKDQFVTIMTDRQRNENGAGRPYWAQSATHIGLINTAEHGIRFLLDRLPPEICVVPD